MSNAKFHAQDLWCADVTNVPTERKMPRVRETSAVSGEKNLLSEELLNAFAHETQLIPAIAQDVESKEVLMLAWMNREALEKTLATRRATYWSRSRGSLWVKGETSGNYQEIIAVRFDCDADSILLSVKQNGPACHTGEKTCFHNKVDLKS